MKPAFAHSLQVLLFSCMALPGVTFAELAPTSVNGLGRGVQNEVNHQTLVLACKEEKDLDQSLKSCDQVGFLLTGPDRPAEWIWNGFHAGNSIEIERDLKLIYKRALEQSGIDFNSDRRLSAFINQKGWNWAETPVPVTEKQYERLLALSKDYARARSNDIPKELRVAAAPFKVGDSVFVGKKLEGEGKITRILENDTFELYGNVIVDGRNLSLSLYSKGELEINGSIPVLFHEYVVYAQVMRISDTGMLKILNPYEPRSWTMMDENKKVSTERTPLNGSKVYVIRNESFLSPYTINEFDKNNDGFTMKEDYYGKEVEISRSKLLFSRPAPAGFHIGQKVHLKRPNKDEDRVMTVTDFIQIQGQNLAVLDDLFYRPVLELKVGGSR